MRRAVIGTPLYPIGAHSPTAGVQQWKQCRSREWSLFEKDGRQRSHHLKEMRYIVVLLCVALVPTMPYGYYGVMRWIVCAAFAYLAMQAHESGRENWMWVWVVAAGVYNPIFKVAASREVWTVVNLVTLCVVGYGWWKIEFPKKG